MKLFYLIWPIASQVKIVEKRSLNGNAINETLKLIKKECGQIAIRNNGAQLERH